VGAAADAAETATAGGIDRSFQDPRGDPYGHLIGCARPLNRGRGGSAAADAAGGAHHLPAAVAALSARPRRLRRWAAASARPPRWRRQRDGGGRARARGGRRCPPRRSVRRHGNCNVRAAGGPPRAKVQHRADDALGFLHGVPTGGWAGAPPDGRPALGGVLGRRMTTATVRVSVPSPDAVPALGKKRVGRWCPQ